VSGYTPSGTGHGASEPSKRRARLRDESGKTITQKAWIVAHIDAAGIRGVTQDEARPDYQRVGIQDSTYTGTRSGAHSQSPPLVVTINEERGEQLVYVTPAHINGRKLVPFQPNTGSRPNRPDRHVRLAAERLERYADRQDSMLVREDVNLADLRTVTKYIQDQA